MEQYTAADGSALPDELFDEYWRWRQEFVCSSTDIETLRAVLKHEPDWGVRASAFCSIDKCKVPSSDIIRLSALRDPHWRVRLLATLRLIDEDDAETLCTIATDDENEIVRRAAAGIIRALLREERESVSSDELLQGGYQNYECRAVYSVEVFLPTETEGHRFYVDYDSISFRSPDGQKLICFYPKHEGHSSIWLTGNCWLDLRDMIFAAGKQKRTLKLTEQLSIAEKYYSTYYFQIKPMKPRKKQLTELHFIECSSACHTDRKKGCRLREGWATDPDALMDKCDGFFKQCQLVLPYDELCAAARDAVVRNETALISLESEYIARWEEEEIEAGTRE